MSPVLKYIFVLNALLFGMQSCDDDILDQTESIRVFEKGIPFLVGSEDSNSRFSIYNTSPESPDGSLISYVKILSTQNDRYDNLEGELWVCNTNLLEHRKVVQLTNLKVHNGVNAQWIDNSTIAYFVDGKIHVINLDGQPIISPISAFSIGHKPHNGKILYSAVSSETNLYSIYEYDVFNNQTTFIADASTFNTIENEYLLESIFDRSERKIRHLIYSPDGSKIALRFDINDDGNGKHLITINKNGNDIKYFGPKPMHFAWYDDDTIMGHDNQIDDGLPNDKSARRWSREAELIETLAGPGNHLSASTNRSLFASESWYNEYPVILKVFKRGQTTAYWQDTVCQDGEMVWELGNHVNPSFSRDGKRVYYHKSTAPGKSQTYMVVLP